MQLLKSRHPTVDSSLSQQAGMGRQQLKLANCGSDTGKQITSVSNQLTAAAVGPPLLRFLNAKQIIFPGEWL